MAGESVFEHVSEQLARLCEVVGTDPAEPVELLAGLLGPDGAHPVSGPPSWPSGIADDHTPVEFSIAYNDTEPPALRILADALGSPPGVLSNQAAGYRFLERNAGRFGLSTARLERVRDLFVTHDPRGEFAMWHSLVFRPQRCPEFKVYLNPELHGLERAPALVSQALDRLGLGPSYEALLEHGVRPGELGRADRLTFFALDLHEEPYARVKLYLTQHHAEIRDVARAAGVVEGVDVTQLVEFCTTAGGGVTRFDGRPLVGSYTFTEGKARPVGYTVYVPIRDYVRDDAEAHRRVVALLARYGFDRAPFERAVTAVTRRRLSEGVGLIAHVSLRLGLPRPGVTVYLSAEAYRVSPPGAAYRQFAVPRGDTPHAHDPYRAMSRR